MTTPSPKVFSKGLFLIAALLEISSEDLASIFSVDVGTITLWQSTADFPSDDDMKLSQIVNLLAINQSLSAMFSNARDRVLWLHTNHPELQTSPLKIATTSPEGLRTIKDYLEGVRMKGA